jgi:hypothetical protein
MAQKAKKTKKGVTDIEYTQDIALPHGRNFDDEGSVESTVSVTTSGSMATLSPSGTSHVSLLMPSTATVRRIASLPLTAVSEERSKRTKQPIQINGQHGIYSGPPIKNKACVLHGCVVWMENRELYVGSLTKNDTGSFTFLAPGTLYGCDGYPQRRIRK